MSRELKKGEYWYGVYKGVSFKIKQWQSEGAISGDDTIWNYYLYLPLSKINEVDAKKLWLRARATKRSNGRKMYHYYNCEPLSDIYMQGDITWYRKSYTHNDDKLVEIGCDYNHIWNDRTYDLDEVYADVKLSVESVLKRFPELLKEN